MQLNNLQWELNVLTVGLQVTQQQHNVERQSGKQNTHCSNYVDYITLVLEKRGTTTVIC